MLVSAAANPLSGRLLKPSESKMEGWFKCGFTAFVRTLPKSCNSKSDLGR
jgi:hypothetical protein